MNIGQCDQCSLAYTSAEVASYGVLKARSEARGGPLVLYRCPECSFNIQLIPHGHGRFAPPGKRPTDEQNQDVRPPWKRARDESPPPKNESPPPRRPPSEDRADIPKPPSGPPTIGMLAAYELLGVSPTATPEEVDHAFRALAQASHPDKVAHLDPAIQAFTSERFMRLRAAYDLVRSVR